jgi:hypothetical protein
LRKVTSGSRRNRAARFSLIFQTFGHVSGL